MKYLIKIEDRENKREAMIECPENMFLEDLNLKIKSELHLPCTDEIGHCFQFNGKVYVTNKDIISELWGHYDDMYLPTDVDIQHRVNYPKERDIRSSLRYRLKQVFTVKESTVVFVQSYRSSEAIRQRYHSSWLQIFCTLIERIE